LVKWHKDHEGTLSWNLLSFYPVRSETAEKVWDPIFSLIEYRNQSNGEKKFSMLLRLYNQKWTENEFEWNIPILMDYSSTVESEKFRLFYGLVGYEKKEEKKYLQLFWFLKL
jgi:ribonucleotide reductase alpha subunit